MNKDTTILIRLDTHKVNTEVAYSRDGREQLEQHFGKTPSTKQAFYHFMKCNFLVQLMPLKRVRVFYASEWA